jgi:hypothetical protein
VAVSFDGRFVVIYEHSTDQDPRKPAAEKAQVPGDGTAGTKDTVGTVYIAEAETGKQLLGLLGILSGRLFQSNDT